HEAVLQPQMRPQLLDIWFYRLGFGNQMLDALADAFRFPTQGSGGIDRERLRGTLPDGQISLGVSHIGKALAPEPLFQKLRFVVALQVKLAIRAMHLVEDTQMCRDRFSENTIPCSDKRGPSPSPAPGLNETDHLWIVGESGCLNSGGEGKMALEIGTTSRQRSEG